jgi:plastocyanin
VTGPRRAIVGWARTGVLAASAVLLSSARGVGAPVAPTLPDFRTPISVEHASGRIVGTVEISTAISARRPGFRIYSDPGAGSLPPAPPKDPIAAELRNVVVYLEGDSARLADAGIDNTARKHGSVAQRDQRFVPHVMPVLQGATVDFPNEDDVYHNVFSLSSAAGPNGFDLGRYPRGSSQSWTFNKPGTVLVFCHIHSDMSAIVLVLANPFFASPGEDHRFVIGDVPEGDYTIVAWHERIKPITRHIHVTAGGTTTLDFNIPLPQGESR